MGEWSPFLDKHLDVKYDAETLEEGKQVAKETLQAELGLAVSPWPTFVPLLVPYNARLV